MYTVHCTLTMYEKHLLSWNINGYDLSNFWFTLVTGTMLLKSYILYANIIKNQFFYNMKFDLKGR